MVGSSNVAFGLGAYFQNADQSDFNTLDSQFQQLMGANLQFYDGYVDFSVDPSEWASNAGWEAGVWAGNSHLSPSSGLTPVIGVPLASNSGGWGNVDNFYKQIISGQYDGDYKGIVDSWAGAGYKTVQFRIAYEFNGNWMPWSPGNSGGSNQDFIAAWQHVANLIHQEGAKDGITAQTVWNPSTGIGWNQVNGQSPLQLYPGDQYVDIISADNYSSTWPNDLTNWSAPDATGKPIGTASDGTTWAASATNREHFWNFPGGTQYNPTPTASNSAQLSLQDLINFAVQHNKPFSLSESGAGNASNGPQGPQDDPAFPQWEAQTLANAVNTQGLKVINADLWSYDYNGSDNFIGGERPQEAAAWAKYFGANSATTDGIGSTSSGGSGSGQQSGGGGSQGQAIQIPATEGTITINQSNVLITATAGDHVLFLGGSTDVVQMTGGRETVNETAGGNNITTGSLHDSIVLVGSGSTVDAGGGPNNITDNGSSNTIILPAVNTGVDNLYGSVLGNGDTLDLRAALAATSWDHNTADIGNYLKTGTDANGDLTLKLHDSATGVKGTIAIFHNYTSSTSLLDILSHSTLQ